MGYIAAHDTRKALELFNRLYAEGKDLGALLDELACLTRDLLVLKTAGNAGITMLSGVASDQETLTLGKTFGSGELVRMMERIQETTAAFTRSSSRRMDVELCLVELCQPELNTDVSALNKAYPTGRAVENRCCHAASEGGKARRPGGRRGAASASGR